MSNTPPDTPPECTTEQAATAEQSCATHTISLAKRMQGGSAIDSIHTRTTQSLDETLVDWDGPDDPENPRNWPNKRKWGATLVVSAFAFISATASSIIAPSGLLLAEEFDIQSTVVVSMITSVFVLGYAIGPLFLGPLSEIFGRRCVLQSANILFFVWNLTCGFSQNTGQLVIFRFLSGLCGSGPLSVGGAVLGDMWSAEERGRSVSIYSLAPLMGPVVGPVAGGWIAQRSTWRWVFRATSIADAFVHVVSLYTLPETFAPVLLGKKARQIRQESAKEKDGSTYIRTKYDTEDRHWKQIMTRAFTRPFGLFFREPIIALLGIYLALVYGIFYLFLTNMGLIFVGVYQESAGIAGLNYIGFGLGLSISAQLNARFMDSIYKHFKRKNGGVGRPEFRLPPMVPGTILLPIGLLITGWTVENHTHWIAPDIGITLVGAGIVLNFQSVQLYVVDAFTLYAASALAAVTCIRSLCGFGFPLFAPTMYSALGFGKGNTILAVIAIVLGCPAPWLLWRYGETIRMHSRYALSGSEPSQKDLC